MNERYHGRLRVADREYGWNFRRAPRVGEGALTGHSLFVFLVDGPGRDLVLDFPYGELGTFETYASRQVILKRAAEGIRLALAAGWDPSRRGKVFRLDVAAARATDAG